MFLFLCLFVCLTSLWFFLQRNDRSACDTYRDLASIDVEEKIIKKTDKTKKYTKYLPLLVVLVVLFICFLVDKAKPEVLIPITSLSFCGTFLVQKRITKQRERQKVDDIEFGLPIMMERLVMAAEAGLDVIPAMKAAASLDQHSVNSEILKPLQLILGRVILLTDQGMTFERALQLASKDIQSKSLHHAFIHLGLAFREGGELLGPLRELSDSTQLLYQETVEEEIAKLPVKATVPLVVIFGGLVLCIMAMPLVQVLSFTGELMMHGK